MSPMIIVLLVSVFVGLGAAAFVYLTELSRRRAAEEAIGGGDSTEIRRRITRATVDQPSMDSIQGRLLKRAPSVWSKDAGIQKSLIHAGFDNPLAPLYFSMGRVVALIAIPLITFATIPKTSFQITAISVGVALLF